MLFCKNDKEQFKLKFHEILNNTAFFTFSGALGIIFGGGYGLFKGIPLRRSLPLTVFHSSAFFGTVSATQGALELMRNDEKDAWNPLISGGWTGFIFGHGITRNLKIGLGMGLNVALMNWAIQTFTLPKSFDHLQSTLNALNPVLLESQSGPLKQRIDTLKSEISTIKK